MADQYEYLSSLSNQETEFMFKSKRNIRIPDTNQGSYPSSQINFNLSSLTTNNYFLSCKQSSIEIPYVISVTSTANLGTELQTAYMCALKKSVCDLVNGISVQLNENSIINFCDLSNLATHFKILSQWSQDDVVTKGDIINFAKNPADSFFYSGAAASTTGIGESNNIIKTLNVNFDPALGYVQGTVPNSGLVRRARKTSYNPTATEIAKYTDAIKTATKHKSHMTYTATQIYYYIMVTIPLNFLHDLFDKLPLIRNPYFKMTLQIHSATTTLNYVHAGTTVTASVSSQYNYNPVMISKCSEGWVGTADSIINIKSSITGGTNPFGSTCYFNACLYEFNPEHESRYISSIGNKLVSYHDIYSNSILAQSGSVNWQIHTGLSKIRGLLVVTHLSGNGLARPSAAGTGVLSINNSPFTSGENMLGCDWANMNVRIGNIPHYPENINYTYDIFQREILSYNSVNGGLTSGVCSGLISQEDFECGVYNYVFVDLSRKNKSEDAIPVTVSFMGTNNSLSASLDLYAYILYENNMIINVDTSQISR